MHSKALGLQMGKPEILSLSQAIASKKVAKVGAHEGCLIKNKPHKLLF